MKDAGVRIPEEKYEEYKQRAEERDTSFSQFTRESLRLRTRLLDTDGVNEELLNQLIKGEIKQSTTSSEPSNNIKQIITDNLSTTEYKEAEEIADIIMEEVVHDAVSELVEEGELKHKMGNGYKLKR